MRRLWLRSWPALYLWLSVASGIALAAALHLHGSTCQWEYGHDPGQAAHWALTCP